VDETRTNVAKKSQNDTFLMRLILPSTTFGCRSKASSREKGLTNEAVAFGTAIADFDLAHPATDRKSVSAYFCAESEAVTLSAEFKNGALLAPQQGETAWSY
jgi:hypothetical protein